MKTKHAMKGLGLVAGLLFAMAPLGAWAAAPTAANTTVTNAVTLDFKVNGTAQTQQTTNAAFKVDEKIVLSVANMEGGGDSTTNTQPGSTKAAIHFQVTNSSNGSTQVLLTGTSSSGSVSAESLYSDAACTTSLTSPLTMAAAAVQDVYVCSTIATSATNGTNLNIGLKAQVGDGSGNPLTTDDSAVNKNATTVTLNTMYKIFADAVNAGSVANTDPNTANDGISSSGGNYTVQGASLTLSKTVNVLEDAMCYDSAQLAAPIVVGVPACAVGKYPHAIPGAYVQYAVTVSNAAGAQSATLLDIKDALDPNSTYVTSSMKVSDNGGAAAACSDNGVTTVPIASTPASTATCNNAGANLEVSGFTVDASRNVVITYRATVN